MCSVPHFMQVQEGLSWPQQRPWGCSWCEGGTAAAWRSLQDRGLRATELTDGQKSPRRRSSGAHQNSGLGTGCGGQNPNSPKWDGAGLPGQSRAEAQGQSSRLLPRHPLCREGQRLRDLVPLLGSRATGVGSELLRVPFQNPGFLRTSQPGTSCEPDACRLLELFDHGLVH